MLRQLLSRTLLLLAIVSLAGEAWSQTAAGSNGRLGAWMNRPADNSNGAQNTALLPAAQPNGGGQPAAQTNGVGIVPAPVAQNDAGFAFRLGNNVGLRAVPPVTVPPGVGNINHPGIAPMPMTMQPSPTGMPPAFPNINSPGLAPSSEGPFGRWPGHPDGRRGHVHNAAPAFYGIPYYVPYVIYTEIPASSPAASPATPTVSGPFTSTYAAPAPGSSQPQQPAAAKPVTLLAFKDHTVLVVTDYWLEGDLIIYETSPGVRTAVPLDRLDFALTQQLNRERNVRFVLESRP